MAQQNPLPKPTPPGYIGGPAGGTVLVVLALAEACDYEAFGNTLGAVSQNLGFVQTVTLIASKCTGISMVNNKRKKRDWYPNPGPQYPGPNPIGPPPCKPCPPNSPYWPQQGKPGEEGCPTGLHYHWYVWDQWPNCTCTARRMTSCDARVGINPDIGPGNPKWP